MNRHLLQLAVIAAVLGLISPALSYGQDLDAFQAFGGFSTLHAGVGVGDHNSVNSLWVYGGVGEFTWFATDWFGITGEVTYYKDSLDIPPGIVIVGEYGRSQTTFLAGVRFRYKNSSRFVPSGRVLMGGAFADALVSHMSSTPGTPSSHFDEGGNCFAVALGGSLDVNVSDRIAIRAIQPDILITTFDGDVFADLRVSTGIVVRFSRRARRPTPY